MIENSPDLERASESAERLRRWLVETALPLWIDRGFDANANGFYERLDFSANPIATAPRRLTVQARQIFVYSRAIMAGWSGDTARAMDAFDAMLDRYWRAGGEPGFAFSVDGAGKVVDGKRDLYAQSFYLLAAAAYSQMTGDSQPIALANQVLDYFDEALATPNGGYFDHAPNPPATLRQNPHMHLFEGLLALYEATGLPAYLVRAEEIFWQLQTLFFQPESGTLPEYFDGEWTPIGGARAVWEPGHHLEWSWLLSEYETLSGVKTGALADRLVENAYRHGVLPPSLIVDEVAGDGAILKRSLRSWPLTEAAKAHAVRIETGDPLAAGRLADAIDRLMAAHLSGVLPGLWADHFDEDGKLLPDYVPASTLYHIAMSVFVTDSVLGQAGNSLYP